MKKFIIPFLIMSFISTGCSLNNDQSKGEQTDNGDTQHKQPKLEYIMGSNDWSVVASVTDSPKILEAYQFAVEHPEVLNYMPCYCGCYEEDGHTSNTNCFVDSVKGDVALLDTMGFG
ncbi:hypothetical protein J7E79_29465 [Bacillus sp. ISL-40]|nr:MULTISPECIES: PCYCGC motif-containing (lipo)protein [unclassified Bacillus (in: firmicutes)]MBT2701388.1 hypothetical protein [Bacillus sp. ISL-40]MBT2743339.1 hypothetical protein [Bacillus sp. ISL-77]